MRVRSRSGLLWQSLGGAILLAGLLAADPPLADDWKFDVVHLKNGRSLRGLVLDATATDVVFKYVLRKPGERTAVFTTTFQARDVERIDRLDRLTRVSAQVPSLVLLRDEEIDRFDYEQAWYGLLRDGFGVFTEPVADLHLYIERVLPGLLSAAFQHGPAPWNEAVAQVRADIAQERQRNEEQDVLDAPDLDSPAATHLFQRLIDHEDEELRTGAVRPVRYENRGDRSCRQRVCARFGLDRVQAAGPVLCTARWIL